MKTNKIINGDSLAILRTIEDNSIDSICTDPPYGINFMGKKWDYDVPSVEVWKECIRVLKPGGHLLSACGTRTQHRMAVNIEDAGFEIRDIISWLYGSGFPKSLNIGKAVKAHLETGGSSPKNLRKSRMGDDYKPTGQKDYRKGRMFSSEIEQDKTSEVIDNKYEGWGTALKPAQELWTLARKPLSEKTVAANVLKWGTGGINIDECRVGTESLTINGGGKKWRNNGQYTEDVKPINEDRTGRFPANIILDEAAGELLDEQSGNKTGAFAPVKQKERPNNVYGKYDHFGDNGKTFRGDKGGASRFFYCAKSSKSERNAGLEGFTTSEKFTAGNYSQSPTCKTCDKTLNGTNDHSKCSGEVYYREMESKHTKNNHPTVKPIKLMEYLIKLITPTGGTVLDPYIGSGTTGVAAKKLGFNCIGIEREEDYVKIAEARIAAVEYEQPEEDKQNKLI